MAGRTDHLDRLESDVSEVTHLLRDNVEKVVDRGERIDDLQSRSEELQSSSRHFQRRATQVRQKMCWQNCRMNCIIAFIVLGILAAIAVVIVVSLKPWEHSSSNPGKNGTSNALPSIPSHDDSS